VTHWPPVHTPGALQGVLHPPQWRASVEGIDAFRPAQRAAAVTHARAGLAHGAGRTRRTARGNKIDIQCVGTLQFDGIAHIRIDNQIIASGRHVLVNVKCARVMQASSRKSDSRWISGRCWDRQARWP
jgi:hypothetical protein